MASAAHIPAPPPNPLLPPAPPPRSPLTTSLLLFLRPYLQPCIKPVIFVLYVAWATLGVAFAVTGSVVFLSSETFISCIDQLHLGSPSLGYFLAVICIFLFYVFMGLLVFLGKFGALNIILTNVGCMWFPIAVIYVTDYVEEKTDLYVGMIFFMWCWVMLCCILGTGEDYGFLDNFVALTVSVAFNFFPKSNRLEMLCWTVAPGVGMRIFPRVMKFFLGLEKRLHRLHLIHESGRQAQRDGVIDEGMGMEIYR